jgi:quercetin dioxygenase-like cupin family protein
MKNPYAIRMNVIEDCIAYTSVDGLAHYDFYHPVERVQKDEMDCMHFGTPETKDVGYHEHKWGCETFFVSQGQMECCVLGRRFFMNAGDLLHIQPYMGHSFKPSAPDTKLNILFQTMDMANTTAKRIHMQENFPGSFESSEMMALLDTHYGRVPRTFPAGGYTPEEEIRELRRDGEGLITHISDNVTFRLKVGRWETHGEKEIWELCMKKGSFAAWTALRPEYHMFYITGGSVAFKVWEAKDKCTEFTAEGQTLVRIPPNRPYRFEALEDSRMYDLDCGALLQDLLEEIDTLKMNDPVKCSDQAFMSSLYQRFSFYYTDFNILP